MASHSLRKQQFPRKRAPLCVRCVKYHNNIRNDSDRRYDSLMPINAHESVSVRYVPRFSSVLQSRDRQSRSSLLRHPSRHFRFPYLDSILASKVIARTRAILCTVGAAHERHLGERGSVYYARNVRRGPYTLKFPTCISMST